MELRQLEYFVAVAETGGMARAAQRLHIVQSAVSQQVARLERELGVRLFERSGRHTRLSPAGELLLPEARAVLAAAERTQRVAEEARSGRHEVLRLGTVYGPGDRLYRTLNALREVAPQLRVRPYRLSLADRLQRVRSGELDAALVRALQSADGLDVLPVWRDPLWVALPADHPAAAASEVRLADLAELPLRLAPREANPPFHDLVVQACRDAGIAPPSGPAFDTFAATLAEIATEPASWTVFYEVAAIPEIRGVAVARLRDTEITTSLAVLPGTPPAPVRHLLAALRQAEP